MEESDRCLFECCCGICLQVLNKQEGSELVTRHGTLHTKHTKLLPIRRSM
jgi:hypothetical protein